MSRTDWLQFHADNRSLTLGNKTYAYKSKVQFDITLQEIKSNKKADSSSLISIWGENKPKKKKGRKNKKLSGKIQYKDHDWTVLDTTIVNY